MNSEDLNILVIDDIAMELKLIKGMLEPIEVPLCRVDSLQDPRQALEKIREGSYDLVITDFEMPGLSGMEVFRQVRDFNPSLPVVILTGHKDLKLAVSAMKEGVYDFLVKPLEADTLQRLLFKVQDHCLLEREIAELRSQIRGGFSVNEIVGDSPEILSVVESIGRCAKFDVNVLVRGESGTGKELIARAIHHHSLRNEKPFVTINIAALSESLIESELFGHVRGAFTGADSDRDGLFREANGGTLFVDEIGDVSPAVQAKLLRLIQFGQFQKVGDNRVEEADVRIIAATSRNLESMMDDGSFRSDLFYRLSVVSITAPPLRDRRTDIPSLVEHFMRIAVETKGLPEKTVSREAMDSLLTFDYPGNIRELQNAIEHALVFSRGSQITISSLPESVGGSGVVRSATPIGGDYQVSMDSFERRILNDALEQTDGNQSEAARKLNMTERRLRYRMDKLGI